MICVTELQVVHFIFRITSCFAISPFDLKNGQLIWTTSSCKLNFQNFQFALNVVILFLVIIGIKSTLASANTLLSLDTVIVSLYYSSAYSSSSICGCIIQKSQNLFISSQNVTNWKVGMNLCEIIE